MRGQVLRGDSHDGPGLVLGDDGKRYSFSQVQVRNGNQLTEGAVVDFVPEGDEARDIYMLEAGRPAAQAAAPPSYASAPGGAAAPPAGYVGKPLAQKSDGVWTYFLRCITRNYAQFYGRARRMEYWGFFLFFHLFLIAAIIVDVVITSAFAPTNYYGEPEFFLPIFTVLWVLYCFLPGLSVAVRRLHDQDLSGWLYLISFVPYVGGIVLLVFMLIDGKPEENKHGPSPKYGVASIGDTFA